MEKGNEKVETELLEGEYDEEDNIIERNLPLTFKLFEELSEKLDPNGLNIFMCI
jgi:hypothetical protein